MKDMVAVIVTAWNFMVSLYGLLWEVGEYGVLFVRIVDG